MGAVKTLALILTILLAVAAAPPLAAQPAAPARVQHVLLVSLDGARPDGLQAVGIAPILQEAAYTMTAQTTVPPSTAPSHMSMVAGVGPEKHGVRDNEWRPGRPYPAAPTVFSVAKRGGLRTALFTQKVYVQVIADRQSMDRVELVPWRPATATPDLVAAAAAYIRSSRPHVILAHITEPDPVGHAEGWMSFAYLQALRRAVTGMGGLRQALREAGIEEHTLVIITADHGGRARPRGTDPRGSHHPLDRAGQRRPEGGGHRASRDDLRYGLDRSPCVGPDHPDGVGRPARCGGVRSAPGGAGRWPAVEVAPTAERWRQALECSERTRGGRA